MENAMRDINKAVEFWIDNPPNRGRMRIGREMFKHEWKDQKSLVPFVRSELESIYKGIQKNDRDAFVFPKLKKNQDRCVEWHGLRRKCDGAPILNRPKHDIRYEDTRLVSGHLRTMDEFDDEYNWYYGSCYDFIQKFQEFRNGKPRRMYPRKVDTNSRPTHLRPQVRVDHILYHHWNKDGCHLLSKGHTFARTCSNLKCVAPWHTCVEKIKPKRTKKSAVLNPIRKRVKIFNDDCLPE